VALPILSAAGIETSILPTAILSTHTGGFTGYTFRDLTEDIEPICAHWKTLDLHTDALYTGYLGGHEQLQLVANIFDDFAREDTIVLVDPAMADQGKLYPAFDTSFALGMRELCAKASIIAPNITEACLMLEQEYPGEDYNQDFIEETLRALAALGPTRVVLTGVSFESDKLGAAAYDATLDRSYYYFTERVEGYFHGTGDIYSSALLAALLNGADTEEAIRVACEFTVGAIRRTAQAATDPKYGVDFEHELPALIEMLA
jgi:pyridoxine kinase